MMKPARMARLSRLLLAVLGSAFALTGCTGFRVYNKADHQLAEQAKSTFEAANISEALDEEYKLLDELLSRELDVVRRHTRARRDAWLLYLVGRPRDTKEPPWSPLERLVNDRMKGLGADKITYKSFDNEQLTRRDMEGPIYAMRAAIAMDAGDQKLSMPPTPEQMADLGAVTGGFVKLTFPMLKGAYDQWMTEKKALDAVLQAVPSSKEFGRVRDEIEAIRAVSEVIGDQLLTRKAKYSAARDAYLQAVADHGAADEEVERKANDVIEAIKKLSDKADLSGVANAVNALPPAWLEDLQLEGRIAKLKEQLEAANKMFQVLTANGSNAAADGPMLATTSLHLKLLAKVPGLIEKFSAESAYPEASHLLIASEHLRHEIEHAKRRQARGEERLRLLESEYTALVVETEALTLAQVGLASWKEARGKAVEAAKAAAAKAKAAGQASRPRHFAASLFETIKADVPDHVMKPTADEQEGAAFALSQYANSWTSGRVHQEEIDYMLIAIDNKATLDAAARSLAQWQNLIGVPITQLEAFYGTGLTKEDVANLIHAAGLAAIAVGVN